MNQGIKLKIGKIALFGIAAFISSESMSFAQSNETHGGGEVVNRKGYRELRDLLDHTNCDWKTGGANDW